MADFRPTRRRPTQRHIVGDKTIGFRPRETASLRLTRRLGGDLFRNDLFRGTEAVTFLPCVQVALGSTRSSGAKVALTR